ncbi:MAG: hypothetical protein KDA72_02450 [Planctomycetales bacterium]|nr:hypothetical protein [Planctomycetales bacterium]
MLKCGDQILPDIKLVAFLGRGEFGEVWKATAPGGSHVALKFVELTAQQGQKEFRAVQRIKGIRHPNI